jgi:hypothetical protein
MSFNKSNNRFININFRSSKENYLGNKKLYSFTKKLLKGGFDIDINDIQNKGINWQDENGDTLMHILIRNKQFDQAFELYNLGNEIGQKVDFSIANNNKEVIKKTNAFDKAYEEYKIKKGISTEAELVPNKTIVKSPLANMNQDMNEKAMEEYQELMNNIDLDDDSVLDNWIQAKPESSKQNNENTDSFSDLTILDAKSVPQNVEQPKTDNTVLKTLLPSTNTSPLLSSVLPIDQNTSKPTTTVSSSDMVPITSTPVFLTNPSGEILNMVSTPKTQLSVMSTTSLTPLSLQTSSGQDLKVISNIGEPLVVKDNQGNELTVLATPGQQLMVETTSGMPMSVQISNGEPVIVQGVTQSAPKSSAKSAPRSAPRSVMQQPVEQLSELPPMDEIVVTSDMDEQKPATPKQVSPKLTTPQNVNMTFGRTAPVDSDSIAELTVNTANEPDMNIPVAPINNIETSEYQVEDFSVVPLDNRSNGTSRQMGGSSVIHGSRILVEDLDLRQVGGLKKKKMMKREMNEAGELHMEALEKIKKAMKVDEVDAKVIKAILYKKIKESDPALSNLDRAKALVKQATKANITKIEKDIKKMGPEIKKHLEEKMANRSTESNTMSE